MPRRKPWRGGRARGIRAKSSAGKIAPVPKRSRAHDFIVISLRRTTAQALDPRRQFLRRAARRYGVAGFAAAKKRISAVPCSWWDV